VARENVEIVQAALAAYMRHDLAGVRALIASDVVFSGRADQPDARDHHGHGGLLEASAEWLEAWDRHTLEAARIWEAGDGIVFIAGRESGRGKTSGVPIETEQVYVSTVRGAKIVSIQIFGSEQEALEAVGLEA
jgi:ketosteroid isomerase-like protein